MGSEGDLSFSQGGHVSGGVPLDFEGIGRGDTWFLVEERVDCIVPSQTFDLDLETEVIGAIGIDQCLF